MKVIGLVCAMVIMVGGACMAATETATYDVYAGWNLVSAPLVPIDSDPLTVFSGALDGIDGLISRWDATSGGVYYDSLDTSAFGGTLLGDGFWLQQSGTGTISYTGVKDGIPYGTPEVRTDIWISLPGNQNDGIDAGAWHLIGQPYNHITPVDDGSGTGVNVLFTDGITVKNWSEAAGAGWVAGNMIGWNNVSGGVNVQFDGLGDDDKLRPGCGYWFQTGKDNLAMIVLGAPEATE